MDYVFQKLFIVGLRDVNVRMTLMLTVAVFVLMSFEVWILENGSWNQFSCDFTRAVLTLLPECDQRFI